MVIFHSYMSLPEGKSQAFVDVPFSYGSVYMKKTLLNGPCFFWEHDHQPMDLKVPCHSFRSPYFQIGFWVSWNMACLLPESFSLFWTIPTLMFVLYYADFFLMNVKSHAEYVIFMIMMCWILHHIFLHDLLVCRLFIMLRSLFSFLNAKNMMIILEVWAISDWTSLPKSIILPSVRDQNREHHGTRRCHGDSTKLGWFFLQQKPWPSWELEHQLASKKVMNRGKLKDMMILRYILMLGGLGG